MQTTPKANTILGYFFALLGAVVMLAIATWVGASSSKQVEPVDDLVVPRTGHAATVLSDGRVFLTGGRDSAGNLVNVSEIFDPATGTSTGSATLTTARVNHTATLLADGRVVVAGGTGASGALSSAEIFDPANAAAGFVTVGSTMTAARTGHTATLLNNGSVLIAGGEATGTAEIFDPATQTFSPTLWPLTVARSGHTATLFTNDSVLLAGGNTNSMEMYTSLDQHFTADATMSVVRTGHWALELSDTRLLLFQGDTNNTIDEFDPTLGTITPKGSLDFHASSSSLLANGKVLVLGTDAAGLYDPDAVPPASDFTAFNELSVPGSSILPRSGQSAVELRGDKKILVAGGVDNNNLSMGQALFNPARIWSDKDDYLPGDNVILSGSGWKPNENVYLYAVDDTTEAWTYGTTVTSDATGGFVVNPFFVVQLVQLGANFHVTAVGALSNMQTDVKFTDANRQININAFSIISPPGATDNVMNLNQTFTVRVQYTPTGSGNWTNLSANLTVPGGWTKSANQSLASSAAGTQVTFDWTVTPNSIVTSGTMSVSVTGTAPTGDTCNSCPFTSNLTVSSVNQAALTINSMTAAKTVGGGTLVKSGDSITVTMVVANSAASPRATAQNVAPSSLTVNTVTGTAIGSCGPGTPASANISSGTQTYTYTCTAGSGNGTLTFTGSASGTDQNSGAAVSSGSSTTTPAITVDNTAPTISSVTGPANGTYGVGQNLNFTVNYDDNVTVTGTPGIPLTIGATGRTASYVSGSGTSALVFRYTVQAGDNDSDGITSASPINLNGGTIQDAVGNNAGLSFTAPNTTGVLVDTSAPTAAITYSTNPVKSGTLLLITATFNEPMADSPVVKIAISGQNTLAATNMTKVTSTQYTYTHTVGAGNGTATVALSVGTDLAGNVITSAPTSGATFTVDNTAPTAAITYSTTNPVKSGTSLLITTTFNEPMADSPVVRLAISGANTLVATPMTKVTSTQYTYTHMVGAGNGTATVALSVGTDLAGNVITSAPTSGATFTVDNTQPTQPTLPDLNGGDDTGVLNTDNITNKTTNLRFMGGGGSVEGNSTVEVFDGGTSLGTTTASNGGAWNLNTVHTYAEGDHLITVTATDAAGNVSPASPVLTVKIDTTPPTVTINQAVGQTDPASTGPINFKVTFSESVGSTFVSTDVTVSGTAGATSGTVTEIAPNDGTTYNVAVATPPNSGTVILNFGAGVATDIAGNPNSAPTIIDNTVTYQPCTSPSVTTQPTNVTTTYGDGDVNFTAQASGSPAPTVQWQVSTNGGSFTDIPSATSETLTIHNPTVAMSGNQYQAVFTNECTPATATSNAATLTVNKANATVVVTPYHVTYDCNEHTAGVASITGKYGEIGATVGTVNVSNTAHTGAGTYSSDTWSFTGTANYNNITAGPATTITDIIDQAPSTTTVTAPGATYTCSPYVGASASVTSGTGSCVLNQSLPVKYIGRSPTVYGPSNTAPTDAGDYTAQARYMGDANHLTSNDSKDFSIAKANATINVPGYHVTYDCNAHTSTGTATGVCSPSDDLGSLLHLNTTHTDAGDYPSDSWTFDGNNNYNSDSDTVHDIIDKADTTSSVTSNHNPSTIGQNVTFTATVARKSALSGCTPTGTVTFKDGSTTLMANVALSGGSATFSTSSLTAGHHIIKAVYNGDNNFNATNVSDPTQFVSVDQWVQYNFIGFLPPVDNPGVLNNVWNTVKAGQTIPIKWQLTDINNTIICDLSTLLPLPPLPPPNGLTSIQVTCPSGPAVMDAVEEVLASPGSTVFRCDGSQYIYNWQTSKSWGGTCRVMTVRLTDGTTHSANFSFSK